MQSSRRESHLHSPTQLLFLASFWISRGETVLRAKADLQRQQSWPRRTFLIYNFHALQVSSRELSGWRSPQGTEAQGEVYCSEPVLWGKSFSSEQIKIFFLSSGCRKKNCCPSTSSLKTLKVLFLVESQEKKKFSKNKIKKVLARRPRG